MTKHAETDNQIITFSRFSFSGRPNKWEAFKKMGETFPPDQIEGLQFLKKVGVGRDGGFSIWPDFGQYGWLAVWDSAKAAESFFKENEVYLEWERLSSSNIRFYMVCKQYHGQWQGQQPFECQSAPITGYHIATITRARVKPKYLFHFWRQVPAIRKSLRQNDKCDLAFGFGEWPIIELATLSFWKNEDDLKGFAYSTRRHQKAIKDTRRLEWYSEEMFSRFYVYKAVGNADMLPEDMKYLASQ